MFRKGHINRGASNKPPKTPALDKLLENSPFVLSEDQRADMTISCRDTEYIPKVHGAGKISIQKGIRIQKMHNGILVQSGGYYGAWMERIITALKGHHEPQEEKVFHEIVKRVDAGSTMIELGAFWAYYSLWFNKEVADARNICCEPDPNNMKVGMTNASLNKANLEFVNAAAGSGTGRSIDFPLDSRPGEILHVPILSIDQIVKDYGVDKVGILHMDVQGWELDSIKGAENSIKQGKVRFLIVSTHHYVFSKDPSSHFKCQKLIESMGGTIIANHTIPESFSGDGLIAASFDKRDKNFKVGVSINSSTHTLFRPYEDDLEKLIKLYDQA